LLYPEASHLLFFKYERIDALTLTSQRFQLYLLTIVCLKFQLNEPATLKRRIISFSTVP
jgi:hypothetical protein